MESSIEIKPTDYEPSPCGCIYVGFKSYIGLEVYWHRQQWCRQSSHVIGESSITRDGDKKKAA